MPGLLGLIACGGGPDSVRRDSVLAASETPRPADSLLLTTPAGIQVWFAAARMAQDSAGTHCIERVMEIRGNVYRVDLRTGQPVRVQ